MRANLAIYYVSYLAIMLTVMLLLVRTLYRCAHAVAAISGDIERMSRFLVTGLCVVSVGYLTLTLKTDHYAQNLSQLLDMETIKLGFGIMLLGAVFSFDLLVLAVWKRDGRTRLARSSELI